MKIRFLELENFKSYAGLHRIGPFQDMMSCIIGPNGCGKSNIIDSLLFVFGFKSDKLRQDNLKSLIHKSSFLNASNCRVSIILETGDRKQLTISRCVSEAGNSSYHVGGRRTTLQEVKNLLFEHGIDLRTNHFMILQGEIEKLAELTPKQLLSHMEYLFGSEVFIEELDNLVIQLNELEIQKHIQQQSLKVKARSLQASKQRRDRTLLWVQHHIRTLKISKILAAITCKKHQIELAKYDKNIGQLEQDCRLAIEMKDKQMRELSDNNKRLDRLLSSLNELKKQYRCLEKSYHQASNRLLTLKTNLQFKEKDFSVAYNRKNDTADEINRLKQIKCDVELPKIKKQLQCAEKQLKKSFSYDQIAAFNTLLRKREELAAKQEQYDKYLKEKQQLHQTLAQYQKQVQQSQLVQNEKQQSVHQVTAEIKILGNQLAKQIQNKQCHQDTLNAIKNSIREISTSAQKESRRSQLLTEMTKMAEKGVIKGFRGRLRDYVWVDKKYQRAFEAVCPHLDFFIVDEYSDAAAASQQLKKKRIGRATFVIIQQIKEQVEKAMKLRFVAPPKCHRLYDIVYGDTFRNILYWSLADTLLVDDLKTAVSVAYGTPRYRVVTIAGDIIDISGVMTSAPPCKTLDLDGMMSKQQLIQKLIAEDEKKVEHLRQQLQKKSAYLQAISVKTSLMHLPQPQQLEDMRQALVHTTSLCQKLHTAIENMRPEDEPQNLDAYVPIKTKVQSLRNKLKTLESSDASVERLQARLQLELKKQKQLEEEMINMQNQQTHLTRVQQQNNDRLEACNLQISRQSLEISQCKENQRRLDSTVNKSDSDSVVSKISWLKEEKQKIVAWHQQATDMIHTNTRLLQSYMEHQIRQIQELANSEGGSMRITQQRRALKLSQTLEQPCEENQKMYKIQVTICKEKMEAVENEGPIDFESIGAFSSEYQQYAKDQQRFQALRTSYEEVQKRIRELKDVRLKTFMAGFSIVLSSVKEIYQHLTRGDIDLSLVDVLNPFEDGVEISVRPVNKSWKKINLLSGGEKTMTALALTFAFSRVRFCPFYLMDEIDAALDYRNTGVLAQYVRNKQKSQMVVISLRRNMYELAESLTGVYKINNCSRTLTVAKDFLTLIAEEISQCGAIVEKVQVTPIRLKLQNTISSHSSVKRSWNGIF